VEYWADSTSGMLDFERKRPERTFRLRYEDIISSPEAALEPMFRFLGVSWHPDLLKSVFTARHDDGVGDGYVRYSGRIHKDSLGLGRQLPVETLPAELKGRMSSLLAELGYGDEPVAPRTAPPPKPERAPDSAADPRERPSWVFEDLLPGRLSAGGMPLASFFSCNIVVHGEGGGSWAVELDETGYRVIPGGEAASRIDVQASDLLDIVHGRANALKIVREGRIQVQGQLSDEALRSLILMIRTDLESAQ
ncbi:MAG TPA: SCP2 sterol-binding domain-containing protein, partial [Thermoanaerobaculia bacterium]|nr:SCP2 sterol-binding domain-containing protein [Thermoanaerobaculia bacterium]